jgi:hypothetical protein
MADHVNGNRFTRGDTSPAPRATRRLFVTSTKPDFSVRENDTPAPVPRFVRGDVQPAPQPEVSIILVTSPEPEQPFIAPVPRSRLMAGR